MGLELDLDMSIATSKYNLEANEMAQRVRVPLPSLTPRVSSPGPARSKTELPQGVSDLHTRTLAYIPTKKINKM